MIDINRIVEFATIQGYFVSDLYKVIGLRKASFYYIRKNKSCEFRMDYFYKLCSYLWIEPKEALDLFDQNSKIDLKKYIPDYDYNILEDRYIKIEELITYANYKKIYLRDIANALDLSMDSLRIIRKDQKKFKNYFFDLIELIGIPYGKAISKYTIIDKKSESQKG